MKTIAMWKEALCAGASDAQLAALYGDKLTEKKERLAARLICANVLTMAAGCSTM